MQWNISYIDAMGFTFRIKQNTQTGRSSRGSFGVLFQQSLPLSNMDIIMGHRLESKGGIPWTLPKFLLLPSPPEASTVLVGSPHLHPCGFHATNMRGKASHRIHGHKKTSYNSNDFQQWRWLLARVKGVLRYPLCTNTNKKQKRHPHPPDCRGH